MAITFVLPCRLIWTNHKKPRKETNERWIVALSNNYFVLKLNCCELATKTAVVKLYINNGLLSEYQLEQSHTMPCLISARSNVRMCVFFRITCTLVSFSVDFCVKVRVLNCWCVVSECATPVEVNKHLELGRDFLARGQLSDALTHYHAAVGKCLSRRLTCPVTPAL